MGSRTVLFAVGVLAASAASAAAVVATIGMLLPGEKVSSTLAPAGELKTVGFAGVEGSSVQIQVVAGKGSAVKPQITVLAPDGTNVDVGATNAKSTGRARAKIAPLAATGVYRIGVQTPSGAGGSFTLSTTCKTPTKSAWTATLDATTTTSDHVVPAAPGGTLTVVVTSKGKPLFDPTVDLLSPAGGVIAHVVGTRGRAVVSGAPLADLGRYTVRTAGGPGTFKATAVVKPLKRTAPAYKDVEARPDVRGFIPTTTTNDVVQTLVLDGVGFSTQQTVSISAGPATKSAQIARIDASGAAEADLDLDDLPPGTYPVYVTTVQGNSTLAPQPIVVTNRAPAVSAIYPFETPNYVATPIDVRGVGFDSTASVSVRRSSDGTSVPTVVNSRSGHTDVQITVTPAQYFTGACDLEIRDPDGLKSLIPGGIDLLGFKAAPAALRTYASSGTTVTDYGRDAAYDETDGHVLLSVVEGTSGVAYVLFDPTTTTVLDTLVLPVGQIYHPRVSWNKKDGTFAVTYLVFGASGSSYVRVVSAQNIHTTIAEHSFPSGYTHQADAAANPDAGGYLFVFDDYNSTTGVARLVSQVISSNGTIDTSTQTTVVSVPNQGYLKEPVLRYQGDGRFVVAWIGATDDGLYFAARCTVVDAAGRQTSDAGPYLAATSTNWYQLFQPELARNPNDGSMLLAYSYLTVADTTTYRPACQLLASVTASPGPAFVLDGNGVLPEGLLDYSIWDPNRNQFIVTMSTINHTVAVRRVNPDASMRPTALEEAYSGVWGILYSGSQPGTLGLERAYLDNVTVPTSPTVQILAAPFH